MFKRLARSPAIPYIGGTLIWAYQMLMAHTLRWRIEGLEHLRQTWEGQHGWILATWHSRILLMSYPQFVCRSKWAKQPYPMSLMVSNSRDGEFTNRAGRLQGLAIIRGSASTNGRTKDKRGFAGAREALQAMSKGGGIVVTIDGPRGPPEVVGIGAIKLAQQMGAPIVVYGLSARGSRVNSWDRLIFPLPFARAAMVVPEPIATSKDMDSEDLRLRVEHALKEATRRADELAGLPPASIEVRNEPAVEPWLPEEIEDAPPETRRQGPALESRSP